MAPELLYDSTTALRASVIDLDLTFVVQLGIFLLLYFLLSVFFFKPYARYLKRRDESTDGLIKSARELTNKADEIEHSMERRLEEARQAGIAERKAITAEASALRDRMVAQERAMLQERVDRELVALEKARVDLLASSQTAVTGIALEIERQINSIEGDAR